MLSGFSDLIGWVTRSPASHIKAGQQPQCGYSMRRVFRAYITGHLVYSFRQLQDTYYPAHHKSSAFVLDQLCTYPTLPTVSVSAVDVHNIFLFSAPLLPNPQEKEIAYTAAPLHKRGHKGGTTQRVNDKGVCRLILRISHLCAPNSPSPIEQTASLVDLGYTMRLCRKS